MNFQFTKTEPALTKAVRIAGCGLAKTDLAGVTVWQTQDFQFNMHTGYHGVDGNHYIYVFVGDPPARDMPRIFVDGKKAGEFSAEGGGGMKPKHINDAKAVVAANKALFLKIVKNLTA